FRATKTAGRASNEQGALYPHGLGYNNRRLAKIAKSMNNRIKFLVVVSSTCLVLLLLIGSVLGKSASPDDAYRHISVYTEVLQRIKSEYVEEPDMKSVTVGALNGLLESID